MKLGDKASFSKTITDADVTIFAGLTGDFNPVHIDSVYAKNTIFKNRIAHGMLGGSLVSTVLGTRLPGPGTIFMEQNLKFKMPVYIGDTLTVEVIFKEVLNSKKGVIKLENQITNQEGSIVTEGYSIVKVPLQLIEEEKWKI